MTARRRIWYKETRTTVINLWKGTASIDFVRGKEWYAILNW